MAEEGFEIDGTVYPFPTSFRLCDPVLVSQITGLSWLEFAELLEDTDRQDPATMAGMIGVAVWQKHPKWPRERVVRFVEQVNMDAIEVHANEAPPVEDEDDDGGNPSEPADEPASISSADASKPARGSPSSPASTLPSTGESGSDTTSPASLQVA